LINPAVSSAVSYESVLTRCILTGAKPLYNVPNHGTRCQCEGLKFVKKVKPTVSPKRFEGLR